MPLPLTDDERSILAEIEDDMRPDASEFCPECGQWWDECECGPDLDDDGREAGTEHDPE